MGLGAARCRLVAWLAIACGVCACGSRTDLAIEPWDARVDANVDAACNTVIDVLPRPVDLLFVIDNSGSMQDEQIALAVELPRLITVLTTGDLDQDGVQDFPAVADLHLGVVSTDMGLPGVPARELLGCGTEDRPQGDNALLLHAANPGNNPSLTCAPSYPAFLSFESTRNDPDAVARDFACVSALGTGGCGYEQQLEAALKALWPSDDRVNGVRVALDRPFIEGQGNGAPSGGNAGFVRNAGDDGQSLIAIVLISDEDDCSSWSTGHFFPQELLPPGDPMVGVAANLRCTEEAKRGAAARLHSIERYIDGFRQLRPGREDLVMFAAIVGVPPDLVTEERIAQVDFSNIDQRRSFYSDVLADARMIEAVDPATLSMEPGVVPALYASCERMLTDPALETSRATPPRRIVQVASGMGAQGIIQSICNDTFRPALDGIIRRLGDTFERSRCVP